MSSKNFPKTKTRHPSHVPSLEDLYILCGTLNLECLPINKPTRVIFTRIQETERHLMDLDALTKAQDENANHQFNELRKSLFEMNRYDIRLFIRDKEGT